MIPINNWKKFYDLLLWSFTFLQGLFHSANHVACWLAMLQPEHMHMHMKSYTLKDCVWLLMMSFAILT